MTDRFNPGQEGALAALIADTPLCWIVPQADPATAILMPVVLEGGKEGGVGTLLGHLPRSAPTAAALAEDRRASFLFLGPHGYIAPADAGRSDWAPTWNFASAKVTGRVSLDAALTDPALAAVVERMEGPEGWTPAELGARYHALAARVIGFRAEIDTVAPRFKLGQDEVPAVRANIITALGDTPLARWMRRFDVS